jgi:transcriptional regulator with XRE-family HTH domain
MSPRRTGPATPRAEAELRRVAAALGVRIRDARLARGWSVVELADRAGLSPDMVYRVESGAPASAGTAARLAVALDRRLEIDIVERRRKSGANLSVDIIHSAMGELEATALRRLGYGVGMDEPYQHYQFAGRADLVAWDLDRRALLHLENRTRFPDFQEMAGAYNAKRAYLGAALAQRLGVRRWAAETHVIVALWTAEVVHLLRLRTASFRALCPDDQEIVERWWSGEPPTAGSTSSLIVLDPLAGGRRERFVGLDGALTARTRHRGYAEVRAGLEPAA